MCCLDTASAFLASLVQEADMVERQVGRGMEIPLTKQVEAEAEAEPQRLGQAEALADVGC